jgi:membrane associated rhomboid family serine protease
MDGVAGTRTVLLRTVARIGAAVLIAGWLALALAGPGLAATETQPAASSPNVTLIAAGLIGAAIAAVWLLRPSGRKGPPTPPVKSAGEADGRDVDSERLDS